MSERFPAVKAQQVVKVARKLGFRKIRQTGSSHAIFRRDIDKRRVVIPIHPGTILKRRTLKSILREMELTIEDFKKLL